MPDAMIPATGVHHVRLTVRDIERSKSFYSALLGKDPGADFSGQAASDPSVFTDPSRLYGGCVFQVGSQLVGLRPVADADDRFDSTRVGLDHLSLAVSSVGELEEACDRLDAAGVTHGEVIRLDGMGLAILSVQDPDDINLEVAAAI